jgi:hypothetical protein
MHKEAPHILLIQSAGICLRPPSQFFQYPLMRAHGARRQAFELDMLPITN